MKQDIILISSQAEHLTNVCRILRNFGMDVFQTEYIERVDAGLASYNPAFIVLNGNMESAKFFLAAVARKILYPLSAPVIKCKKTPRKKCSFVAERKEKR